MDIRNFGGLFIIGFHGTEFDPQLKDLLEELHPAGIILFARNIESPRQVAELNRTIQRHALENWGEGLLIGVDQEGGRVRRLKYPFTEFPPVRDLALSLSPDEAVRNFARTTAREIKLTGFNVDFVPVMDVVRETTDLGNSVIGDRSFGPDPLIVSQLGRVVEQTMREEGIITCCKHFPGHGGTTMDSHKDLPVDSRERTEIEQVDLIPFRDAIKAGTEMVMTAHVKYPAFDQLFPATLSHELLTDLLRNQLRYDKVIITDDLDMGAVAKHYSPEDSALLAFEAGADILLICNAPEKAFSAGSRLMEAFQEDRLTDERIRQSLRRISSLKLKYASSLQPCEPVRLAEYFQSKGRA